MEDEMIYLGEIVPKPRMTQADKWKHRPIVERYYAFKDSINLQANQQDFKLGESYAIVFYMPMAPSWSPKKKEDSHNQPHRQKPDLDNLIKAVQDSLIKEDSSIWHFTACKVWTTGESRIKIVNISDNENILLDVV